MWIYSTIIHPNREALGLTNDEWCVLDAIYRKQTHPETAMNGWALYSVNEIINDFAPKSPKKGKKYRQLRGWSRRSVFSMLKDLQQMGFIKRKGDYKKTTAKWYKNAYEKVKNGGAKIAHNGGAKIAQGVQKLHSESAKIAREGVQKLHPTLYNISIDNCIDNLGEKNKKNNLEISHFQIELEEKNQNQFPPNPPKPEREFSAIMMAQKAYEKARENFQKDKGLQPDIFSWEPKTLSELEKVTVRLKEKMRVNGRTWEHDKDFTQKYLAPFFEAAAISHIWFNSIFSIGIMANRFADTYDEIIMQKNGNTKAAKNNDPNGHLISAEDAARATANVIKRMREKRERRVS